MTHRTGKSNEDSEANGAGASQADWGKGANLQFKRYVPGRTACTRT